VKVVRGAMSSWKRGRKEAFAADWRPCPKGARNVTALAMTIPHVTTRMIADALGMPGTLLRALIADHDARVPPRFHTALETITADDVGAWIRPGTRGRIRRPWERTREPPPGQQASLTGCAAPAGRPWH